MKTKIADDIQQAIETWAEMYGVPLTADAGEALIMVVLAFNERESGYVAEELPEVDDDIANN